MISWDAPSRLDKAEDRRGDPAFLAAVWAADAARVLAADATGRLDWDGRAPAYRPTAGEYRPADHVLLGLLDSAAVFAERTELPQAPTLRDVMDSLSADDLAVVFAATALVGWHAASGFCGWCGAPTVPARGGQARRCTGCHRESYPRLDPAVIVAITDADDRLLLGRQPSWAPGRVSVFAGFTEAGESLEQAVHREVFEEVGLRLEQVRYLGSQPWPFPRSLMLGFTARAVSVDLVLDPGEIAEARWFTRDALARALAAGEVSLPMATSIAHRMITAWQQGGLG